MKKPRNTSTVLFTCMTLLFGYSFIKAQKKSPVCTDEESTVAKLDAIPGFEIPVQGDGEGYQIVKYNRPYTMIRKLEWCEDLHVIVLVKVGRVIPFENSFYSVDGFKLHPEVGFSNSQYPGFFTYDVQLQYRGLNSHYHTS